MNLNLKLSRVSNLFMRVARHRPVRRRRGQALIEMAIVMTVLLILTFGMADFGLLLTGQVQASNCAREVARRAVVRDADALNSCAGQLGIFQTATITLNPNPWVCEKPKTAVTATVAGTYRWVAIAPLINALLPGSAWNPTITTKTNTTMRLEALREGTC